MSACKDEQFARASIRCGIGQTLRREAILLVEVPRCPAANSIGRKRDDRDVPAGLVSHRRFKQGGAGAQVAAAWVDGEPSDVLRLPWPAQEHRTSD